MTQARPAAPSDISAASRPYPGQRQRRPERPRPGAEGGPDRASDTRADGGQAVGPGERRRGLVPVLAFAGISVAVMQTLLVPVVARLPALLHTPTSDAAWVITATLLSGAVATPIMGRLGDLYGKRRFALVSLGLMVLGSVLCGLTSSLVPMVAGRALQGFAMGAIPLGISIMRDELPPHQLGSAMAFMSSSLGVGGALGMPLAAYVAQHTDWHALFFGAAGLGVLAMLLVVMAVPESSRRAGGRFDVVGALGLTAGLVALLLPVSKGSDWGWGSGTTLGLFGAAVLIFLGWGMLELRLADPLVDLRTTARRQVLLTNLASITVGLAYYAITLVLPQLLQLPASTGYGLGRNMVVAGICVAPMGLAMMAVSSLSARLSATRGPKVSLMAGLVVLALAYLAGTVLMDAVWQTVLTAVLVGVGIGIAYSAMPALILGAVDPSESGAANGLNTLMRSIGTSTSSAVIGVVLAHMTRPLGGRVVPQLDGFRVAFLIAAGAALLGLLIAAFLPGQRAASRPGARVRAPEPTVPHGGVRGTVRDPHGQPLPGALVTLLTRGGRQLDRANAAPDGGYRLNIPADGGDHVLLASAAGHLPEARPFAASGPLSPAPAAAGRGGHGWVGGCGGYADFTLRPAVAVRGAIRERGGRPLAGARVTLLDTGGQVLGTQYSASDGGYLFAGLREGTYTLVARGGGAGEAGDGTIAAPVTVDGSASGGRHDLYLP